MSRRVLVTGGSGFIGTRLVTDLVADGAEVLNLDIAPPNLPEQLPLWRECDILDAAATRDAVRSFAPDALVHLAARTDTDSDDLADYRVNCDGSRHVLLAARDAGVGRLVLTSTQFVVRPGYTAAGEEDYNPHTAYGESKAISEEMLRTEFTDLEWVIVRPTNIWGPWHPRYPTEFWRVLSRRLYVHPGGRDVVRCYGYVATVSDQLRQLLELPAADVAGRTFYLGDPAAPLSQWVDAFSMALTGHRARRVPRAVLRTVALAGDAAAAAGVRPPLTSSRYRSMTEDYPVPMEPTFALLGLPHHPLQEGVDETVSWLRAQR